MTRQEYVEWAMEDIIFPLEENTDLLVTWLSPSKDCRCPITFEIANALTKLYDRYDFVIFDCEYDLKYLMQLVDYLLFAACVMNFHSSNDRFGLNESNINVVSFYYSSHILRMTLDSISSSTSSGRLKKKLMPVFDSISSTDIA